MRLLLDTHVFLWYISGDPALPPAWRDAIRDPRNEVSLSVVSVWEAVIKHGLGKLPLPGPPSHYLPEQRRRHQIAPLPLEEAVVAHLANLPFLHRDPFDRMLVAQALHHGLTLVSMDRVVRAYPAPSLEPP